MCFMEIIQKLQDHSLWLDFLNYKIDRGDMRKSEQEDLTKFVDSREYLEVVSRLQESQQMSLPRIIEINKNGVNKKRAVFTFEREENFFLKMLAYILKEYDGLFCDNLYSFRNNTGVKKAIWRIVSNVDFCKAYSYKVDIHDYFNSINVDRVLEILKDRLPDEKWLYSFFECLLNNPYALKDGTKVAVKKGVMAGTPTAGFLANLYLCDMDKYFMDKNVIYARYSDDIIVFSDSEKSIEEYENVIKDFLHNYELEVNPAKEIKTGPGEKIEFLGFAFAGEEINVSDIAEKKIKAKIKRKARSLYRWKVRKSASDERTAKAFIRYLNNKFYHNAIRGEITWCRWYFPLITTDDRIRRIDEYAVQNIRYLYTGKYGKKNYDLKYESIKAMGYRSLVNNYWKYKSGRYEE